MNHAEGRPQASCLRHGQFYLNKDNGYGRLGVILGDGQTEVEKYRR